MLPFFFMHPATTAIYTLSLHDALPICRIGRVLERGRGVIDDRPEDILLGGDVGVEAGALDVECAGDVANARRDRKSTRLNSSHRTISYAVFCLKKKNKTH